MMQHPFDRWVIENGRIVRKQLQRPKEAFPPFNGRAGGTNTPPGFPDTPGYANLYSPPLPPLEWARLDQHIFVNIVSGVSVQFDMFQGEKADHSGTEWQTNNGVIFPLGVKLYGPSARAFYEGLCRIAQDWRVK